MAWSAPKTWAASDILTAADMNAYVRDNHNYLKGTTGDTQLEGIVRFDNDSNFFVDLSSSHARHNFDSSDYYEYDRSNNHWEFVIGSTQVAQISDSQLKFPLDRQGGSATDWGTTGTTNYNEIMAFIQCGCIGITFSTAESASISINLPVALTNAGGALVFALMRNDDAMVLNASISGTTGLLINARNRDSGTTYTGTVVVQWAVLGK